MVTRDPEKALERAYGDGNHDGERIPNPLVKVMSCKATIRTQRKLSPGKTGHLPKHEECKRVLRVQSSYALRR